VFPPLTSVAVNGEAARYGEEDGGEGGEGVRELAHAESGHTYLQEDGQ
jgi:hypothetical protein